MDTHFAHVCTKREVMVFVQAFSMSLFAFPLFLTL